MNRGRDRDSESYGGNQPVDDQPTQYFGEAGNPGSGPHSGHADSYNPDADFAGGSSFQSNPETQFDLGSTGQMGSIGHSTEAGHTQYSGRAGASGQSETGQFWAPLTPEERGLSESAHSEPPRSSRRRSHRSESYESESANHMSPRRNRRTAPRKSEKSTGFSWGKSAAIVSVVAILAILALVLLMVNFVSGGNSAGPTSRVPSPSSETSTSTSTETPTRVSPSDRVQEELDRLQDNPPALPGLGDVTSGYGTIPVGVVGKSPASVQAELAANGFWNVKVFDRNGNETNSALALMDRVAAIDPPEGQGVALDTQVNIYLQ